MGEEGAKLRCEKCGFSDFRALHTHHIKDKNGKVVGTTVLCANCHYILHRDPSEFRDFEKRALEITRKKLKEQFKLLNPVVTKLKELGAECQVQVDPRANEIYRGETESHKALEIEGWVTVLRDIYYRLVDSGYSCTVRIRYREGSQGRGISLGGDFWPKGKQFTAEEHVLYMRFLDKVRKNMMKENGVVYPQNRLPLKWSRRFEEWKKGEVVPKVYVCPFCGATETTSGKPFVDPETVWRHYCGSSKKTHPSGTSHDEFFRKMGALVEGGEEPFKEEYSD